MTLSDKKLYCGDRNKGQIIDTVNLYTDLKDVQNQGKVFNYNGETLYAKWGEVNNGKASKIHCRVNSGEKAVLKTSYTTIIKLEDFKTTHTLTPSRTYGASDNDNLFCASWSDFYSGKSAYYEYQPRKIFPVGATNKKLEFRYDYVQYGYPEITINGVGSYNYMDNNIVATSIDDSVVDYTSIRVLLRATNREKDAAYMKLDYIKLTYDIP